MCCGPRQGDASQLLNFGVFIFGVLKGVFQMLENVRGAIEVFGPAVLVGILSAVVCSVLGVFVVTKRVVFIGITLSEVAACGVALAMLLGFYPMFGSVALTTVVVLMLAYPFESSRIPRDAVLGVTFVLAAGLSILLVSKSAFGLERVKAILYGNLLFASQLDIWLVSAVLLLVLCCFILFLRPMLYTFLDREMARVLGVKVGLWELVYFFALGLAVSAVSKVAGSVLVFCYLIVPPSTGMIIGRRLRWVFLVAGLSGSLSTIMGMYLSYAYDVPTSQSIAVMCCALFGLVVLCSMFRALFYRSM